MIAEQKRLTRAALLAAAGAMCVAPSSVRAQNLTTIRVGAGRRRFDCNAHSAEITPLLAKFIGMDPKAVAAMPREELWSSLDVRLIQPVIDTAARYKGIPRAFPAREFVDPAALTG
jgi:hypothetical protein